VRCDESQVQRECSIRPVDPHEGERLREIAIAAKSYWGYDLERVVQWAAMSMALLLVGTACGARSEQAAQPGEDSTEQIGQLTADEVAELDDFPVYGLTEPLDGLALSKAIRIGPETLAEAPPPVQTTTLSVRTDPDVAAAPKHDVVSDFLSLIYGECEATPTCGTPLQIQIWESCNRYVDDYESAPGTPYPHKNVTIRRTSAAEFDDRIEVYAGSVSIVIFAGHDLAQRAAAALRPLNDAARVEMAGEPDGDLPPAAPGPDCV
jgi:hypothetical protein